MSVKFMVFSYPYNNDVTDVISEPEFFDEFDKAYDAMAEMVRGENVEMPKRPKRPQPLCVDTKYDKIELWVCHTV